MRAVDELLLSKAYKDLDKKVQKSYVSLTLSSKNDLRNLVNFDANSGKSEKLHFDVLLFSIAYKLSQNFNVGSTLFQRCGSTLKQR